MLQELAAAGHDGVFSTDESGGVRGVEWVALRPAQIKSAYGNCSGQVISDTLIGQIAAIFRS